MDVAYRNVLVKGLNSRQRYRVNGYEHGISQ